MFDFPIPHIPPIRFVKSLLSRDEKSALVEVEFDTIPSLGMLVEAAAQSSSGVAEETTEVKMGFLVSLKNIKLLQELQSRKFTIEVAIEHKLQDFKSLSFGVFEDKTIVATGSFAIAIQ